MNRIDFHTHAFEDTLAEKALTKLVGNSGLTPALDGRVASLRASMKRAGISKAVVCPIATRPRHFEGIRAWARLLRESCPELEMMLSVHPDDPDALTHLQETAGEGFKGVKFHPYYQDFAVDERRMWSLYEQIRELNLLAVFHCGFDIAFPYDRIADPARMAKLADDFPGLKLVTTHFGGWMDWEESRRHLIGRDIYIETSMTLMELPPAVVREMAMAHPADRLLFGTDSPWTDEAEEIARWEAMGLPPDRLDALLGGNAEILLASSGHSA